MEKKFDFYVLMLKDFKMGTKFPDGGVGLNWEKDRVIGLNDKDLTDWLIDNGYAKIYS